VAEAAASNAPSKARLASSKVGLTNSKAALASSTAGLGDQRKSQLHHFTIGFQKPGICADSWFLESNGKMVQLGFSLITGTGGGRAVSSLRGQNCELEEESRTGGRESRTGDTKRTKFSGRLA
jgi:hypothetical protein